MLLEACQNPKHPGFSHYLFEAVAALIRHGTAGAPAMAPAFEEALFPAFEHVLQRDVQARVWRGVGGLGALGF